MNMGLRGEVDWTLIDSGRAWRRLLGEGEPPVCCGRRIFWPDLERSPELEPYELHGESGRGRSKEARPNTALSATPGALKNGADVSRGSGVLGGRLTARFSKWDSREETGRYNEIGQ